MQYLSLLRIDPVHGHTVRDVCFTPRSDDARRFFDIGTANVALNLAQRVEPAAYIRSRPGNTWGAMEIVAP